MSKRIFVFGIEQETCCFNPTLTGMREFIEEGIWEGEALVDGTAKIHGTLDGILDCVREYGFTPVGGTHLWAKSGGPVSQEAIDWFCAKTRADLEAAGPIDGVMAALHGATLGENSEDVCGDVLEMVRELVGKDIPIASSFDLHGKMTRKISKNANYISGYQTYPHMDLYNTGYRAAKQLCEHLSGRPSEKVCISVPIISPPHGYTTSSGGLKKLMARGHKLVEDGEILDFTIFQVQPWLDVSEIGTTVVVSAYEKETARRVARSLAEEELSLREELQGPTLMQIDEAIARARENDTGKPVVLVESADSPNAGACGDSPAVLGALLPYRDTLKAAVAITDEAAVAKAFELGVGAQADFTLGATLAPRLYTPVTVENATVVSLHTGRFFMFGPAERGFPHHLGRVAVLEAGNILIHLSEMGNYHGDIGFYRSFGIEPERCDLVSVKACTSFRAGYTPIAGEICVTSAPGAAGPVLTELPYEHIPKTLYPFAEVNGKMLQEF